MSILVDGTNSLRPAKQFAEKGYSCCHSERSEESLCAERQEKERFLVAALLGMTRLGSFSASCKAMLGERQRADALAGDLEDRVAHRRQNGRRRTARRRTQISCPAGSAHPEVPPSWKCDTYLDSAFLRSLRSFSVSSNFRNTCWSPFNAASVVHE